MKSIVYKAIKKHIGMTIVLIGLIGIVIYVSVLPPLVMETIVNQMMMGTLPSTYLIALYIGLLVISGLLDSAKEIHIVRFGQMITKEIRKAMEEKIQKLPTSYLVKQESGEMTSRFVNDVDTVEALFTSGIFSMLVDLGKIISILFVIYTRSIGLGILLTISLPILYIYTKYVQKRTLLAQKQNRKAIAKANALLPTTLSNIRIIHLLHSEIYHLNHYSKAIDDSFRAQEKSNFYDSIYSPTIIMSSVILIIVMMLGSTSSLAIRQLFAINVGTSVMLINYIGKIFTPLESIGMEIQNIQLSIAGIQRINEFLKLEEEKIQKQEQKETNIAIQFDHVDFKYDTNEKDILKDYSLELPVGTHATVIGRTGRGKSTLFKLILGLYDVNEGYIEIFGQNPKTIKEEDKRSIYGYVEQAFHPIEGTIGEQISLKDPTITREQIKQALEITELWERVCQEEKGMDTPYSDTLFSQGQIQLLSISRAIVKNPKLLLLDEITANLDSKTEKSVLQALRKASEERTVLSITHRLFSDTTDTIIEL